MTVISRIRRQGGAAIITIPSALLKEMHAGIGSEIELAVHDGELVARSAVRAIRKRYRLEELLEGSEHMAEINAATASSLEGDAVGRELS